MACSTVGFAVGSTVGFTTGSIIGFIADFDILGGFNDDSSILTIVFDMA